MADLSHWDCAVAFTGEEAAALAVGEEPSTPGYTRVRARPLYERMEAGYARARRQFHDAHEDNPPNELLDSAVLCSYKEDDRPGASYALVAWLEDDSKSGFQRQHFTRQEMARWLSESGIQSAYRFDLELPQALAIEAEKPLGTTERNTLLTIIAVLCKEAKLDHTKHAKTAGLIQSTAAKMGVSIGETTIERHLKKIPNALETRM